MPARPRRDVTNLIGKPFGLLTVQALTHRDGRWWATCLCHCGATVQVRLMDLENGHTVSCGCARQAQRQRVQRKWYMAMRRTA